MQMCISHEYVGVDTIHLHTYHTLYFVEYSKRIAIKPEMKFNAIEYRMLLYHFGANGVAAASDFI